MYTTREFRFSWSPKQPWHSISVIVIGLIMGAVAYFFYDYSVKELESAIHAEGIVSRSIINKNGQHTPIIQFKNKKGKVITFLASISSTPQKYFEGDKVKVLYFSEKNKKPRINNWLSNWAVTTFFTVFSIFSFIMSGVIWLVRGNGKIIKH